MKNKEFIQQKKAARKFDDCLHHKKKTEDRAGLLSPSCPSGRLLIAPLVELPRFELRITEPKSAVLPLHHSSIVARKR